MFELILNVICSFGEMYSFRFNRISPVIPEDCAKAVESRSKFNVCSRTTLPINGSFVVIIMILNTINATKNSFFSSIKVHFFLFVIDKSI